MPVAKPKKDFAEIMREAQKKKAEKWRSSKRDKVCGVEVTRVGLPDMILAHVYFGNKQNLPEYIRELQKRGATILRITDRRIYFEEND